MYTKIIPKPKLFFLGVMKLKKIGYDHYHHSVLASNLIFRIKTVDPYANMQVLSLAMAILIT